MQKLFEDWRRYLNEQAENISYGVLPYRIADDRVEFLLGLIPQRSYWTVFKGGMEEEDAGSEHDAVIREFMTETSLSWPADAVFDDNKILSGVTGSGKRKKELKIWLIEMPTLDILAFNADAVEKITDGQWAGSPEIIEIKWMDGETAASVMPKSQKEMIAQAEGMIQ